MFATLPLPEGWKSVQHPPSLFRRFQFASYRDTRAFLDRLAALSEETGLYPDLGFGPTHVNVTRCGFGVSGVRAMSGRRPKSRPPAPRKAPTPPRKDTAPPPPTAPAAAPRVTPAPQALHPERVWPD